MFSIQNVKSDKIKFAHVLSALSPITSDAITDILENPPKQDMYLTLKNTLIERLSPSDERKLEALLTGQDMGDRRPSETLRHIKTLAGNKFTEAIIKSLWIRRLPEIIKIAMVAQQDATPLDDLARTADKMYEAIGPKQQISAFIPTSSTVRRPSGQDEQRPTSSSQTLEDRLTRLESKINSLLNTNRSRSQNRRSSPRSRHTRAESRSPSTHSQHGMCWYHYKYGKNAQKCLSPCKFGPSSSKSMNNMEVEKNE